MAEPRINICPSCKNPVTESSDYSAAAYYKGLSTFICSICSFNGPMISVTKGEFLKLTKKKAQK